MPAEKIGVYIDESSVAPYLSADELAEFVKNKYGNLTPVVKTHPRLNSEDGRGLIQADIDAGAVDAVCICGTTPRVDWDIFDFEGVQIDRVNLREQCIMCYRNPDGSLLEEGQDAPEELTLMAQDYIKMGVSKLSKSTPPEPEIPEETYKTILVLGGGFTGMTAALNAAAAGYEVVIVEKEGKLGGRAAKLKKTFPLGFPYTDDQDTGIDQLVSSCEANGKITVKTGATLDKLAGAPGTYTATVGGEELQVGAVVLATGWKEQSTEFLEPYGYGKYKNVVTAWELEEMASNGGIKRPSDGGKVNAAAFVIDTSLVVTDKSIRQEEADLQAQIEAEEAAREEAKENASDDEEGEKEEMVIFRELKTRKHLAETSELSSMTAVKQAGYLADDGGMGYVIYDHMMMMGINERYYKSAQDKPGVMMTKGFVSGISEEGDGSLVVKAKNTLLGEDIELKVDLVVLPTGMVPTTAKEPTINLEYRQGPAFPELELFDGYADSNYICFPYETRRTGVYAAGCIRQPMPMSLAKEDAAGAALKAIQCITSLNRGMAVHPRSGDKSYPRFNFVRCTQCKRCTEECPFGALDDDPKGTPLPNPTRCRRCGTCMGACPERVIFFDNYNIDQIGTMIKDVEIPPKIEEGGPRAIILACENDAYPALDMAAQRGNRWSPYVRIIPVRCLGSVNTIWIADAMSKGTDGVMLLGCKYGEDYQCHFVKGSELCNRRMENVAESLNRLGVEPERVVQKQVAIDEYQEIPDIIDNFMNYILKLGPNPFKGY